MHWQEELILGGRVKSSQDILLRCVEKDHTLYRICLEFTLVLLEDVIVKEGGGGGGQAARQLVSRRASGICVTPNNPTDIC